MIARICPFTAGTVSYIECISCPGRKKCDTVKQNHEEEDIIEELIRNEIEKQNHKKVRNKEGLQENHT